MFVFSNVSGYSIKLLEKEAKNHLGVMQMVMMGWSRMIAWQQRKSEYI